MGEVSISATARQYPRLPYQKLKDDILGTGYRLSLVFVGRTRAQQLNRQYRHKDYVPNVLSFPLDETTGEIFITPTVATSQSAKFDLSPRGYIGFLYIHALLHLKGHAHGDTMEKAERHYLHKYDLR